MMNMSQNVLRINATASGTTDAPSDVSDRSTARNGRLSLFSPRKILKIANWNVRTTSNRLNLLVDELDRYDIDVAIITEARIPGSGEMTIDSTEGVPKYKCFYSGGSMREYGVAILIKTKLRDSVISFEALTDRICVLKLNGTITLSIFGVYAPTNTHSDQYKNDFYEYLQEAIHNNPSSNAICIAGDLNAETGSERAGWKEVLGPFGTGSLNDNSIRLLTFATHNNLMLANSWFRHKRAHKVTWHCNTGKVSKEIDHFLFSNRFKSSVQDVRVKRGACIGSDHNMTVAKISLRLRRCHKGKHNPVFDFNKLGKFSDASSFALTIENKFAALPETQDIDEDWGSIREVVQQTLNETCPRKVHKKKPWISDTTLQLVNERRNAVKRNQKTTRNRLNKMISASLLSDEENWYNEQAKSMEDAAAVGDTRKLFGTLRSLTNQRNLVSDTIEDTNGNVVEGKSNKLERWAEHFESLLNRPNPTELDNDILNALPQDSTIDISELPPSREEIETAIKELKNNKSPGLDGIPPEAIKLAGKSIIDRIHKLTQNIWTKEEVPQDWKDAIIIPIHKKGSKKTCSNYRGVSLLAVASKILTSIIRKRMNGHYESTMRESQAGFRQGRGCTDQIFSLRQVFERRIRHGKKFACIFIDFEAAFDSVHRESLWACLIGIGLPSKIVNIIKSFYHNNRTVVRVYGENSNSFSVQSGVRQGCILSPCLFNIVLDKLLTKATQNCNGVILSDDLSISDFVYADDVVYLGESENDIQRFISQLDTYGKMIGLRISTKKTRIISDFPININLSNETIERVERFTYLGSIFTSQKVSCIDDIVSRIGKSSSAFGRLKKQLFARKDISVKTKMRVFNSVIIPILLYGSESWTVKTEDIRQLEVIQMYWLRIINGISRYDRIRNNEIRCISCHQPQIEEILRRNRLRWFGHLCRMEDSRIPKRIFVSKRPSEWKCPRTAPRSCWKKTIESDLRQSGITTRLYRDVISAAASMAMDRDQWRGFVRDASSFASNNHNTGLLR